MEQSMPVISLICKAEGRFKSPLFLSGTFKPVPKVGNVSPGGYSRCETGAPAAGFSLLGGYKLAHTA